MSLDTKALLAAVMLCWLFSELRNASRRREDAAVIRHLRLEASGGERAQLETERPDNQARGAALVAGKVAGHGRDAGQYFSTILRNSGALAAEDIQVTAALGPHTVRVVSAPRSVAASRRTAPIELRLPFGLLSRDEAQRALRAGIPLRLQIAYRDVSQHPHLLDECFTFVPTPRDQVDDPWPWRSQRAACPV